MGTTKKPGSLLFSGGEPGFLNRFFEGFLAQKYFTYITHFFVSLHLHF